MAIQVSLPDDSFLSDPFGSALPNVLKQHDNHGDPTRRRRGGSFSMLTRPRASSTSQQLHAESKLAALKEDHVNPSWGRHNCGSWTSTLGTGAIVAFCPLLVIIIQIALIHFDGSIFDALFAIVRLGPVEYVSLFAPRPTTAGFAIYGFWLLFQVVLYRFLPAQRCYGQTTPAGHLLGYNVNGTAAWAVSHLAYAIAVYNDWLDAAIVAKNWMPLILAFNVYGYLLSAFAFVKAHVYPTHEDDRKFSGSLVYDFYMGIELNPRIGDWFDFKLFHNGRPGIVAWTLM